jgi:hypothetical protein
VGGGAGVGAVLQGGSEVAHDLPLFSICPQQQLSRPPGKSWQLVPPQCPQLFAQQHVVPGLSIPVLQVGSDAKATASRHASTIILARIQSAPKNSLVKAGTTCKALRWI